MIETEYFVRSRPLKTLHLSFSVYFQAFQQHFRCVQLREGESNKGRGDRAGRYSAEVLQNLDIFQF